MIELVFINIDEVVVFFLYIEVNIFISVNVLGEGKDVLVNVNVLLGFVLVDDEIDYLFDSFIKLGRNLIDVEFYMFV